MEKVQQQHLWRAVKSRLSYKNATFVFCSFNVITTLFLLHSFFYSPSSKLASSQRALFRHIKECEDIRRAMVPLDLIKRVREIGQEMHVETEQVQQKEIKQTAAVGLISRLNNFRSNSDAGSTKALEEWRKRKMERARQRLVKNGVTVS
ncbi:cyclic nucleotide gated channel 5 [Striga asiatica]|uniref:Cyclic nucleotide gated channel 5 n=1 Tax=Striga asiatica TaxID=4170 RepID=A0A5A7PDK0_STRAF|nr:cyclic nucleotide gated channel 5 [Striga asiatica]